MKQTIYEQEIKKIYPKAIYQYIPTAFKRKHQIVEYLDEYPYIKPYGYGYCSEQEAWENAYEKLIKLKS